MLFPDSVMLNPARFLFFRAVIIQTKPIIRQPSSMDMNTVTYTGTLSTVNTIKEISDVFEIFNVIKRTIKVSSKM